MVILLCFLPRKAEAESAVRQFTAEGCWHCPPPRSMNVPAKVFHATQTWGVCSLVLMRPRRRTQALGPPG